MQEYLIEHAQNNVWCNPIQDNQLVFLPEQVTGGAGSLNTVRVLERSMPLPVTGVRTHVYQVGQLSPALVGLLERNPSWSVERWIPFMQAMRELNLYMTIYTETGVVLPRFNAHFMFTREKCLIFAIPQDSRLGVSLGTERLYFRLYTNEYFKSPWKTANAKIQCAGYEPKTTTDIINAQVQYAAVAGIAGHAEVFVNGYLVQGLSPATVKIGDVVEWIHDPSVKRLVTFTIADLQSFVSTLDSKTKYLLHHTAADVDQIDFQDDVDLYIHTQPVNGAFKGRYYHKNLPMAMRMVTHRDYSVPAEFVDYISSHLSTSVGEVGADRLQHRIFMKIREGGYKRKLIHDASRIFEMYKLEDADVVRAMVGVNSLVPEWRAPALEANAYARIMRAEYTAVKIEDVEDGYGYNSIAQVLADAPTKTYLDSGIQRASLAYALQKDSTIYEFDREGSMLGWHYHLNDNEYETRSQNARLIEGIVGGGTDRMSVQYGKTNLNIPTIHSYRVYYCRVMSGVPNNQWEDITGDPRYSVVNGKLVWTSTETDQWLMVRTDEKFLAYDFTLQTLNGILSFVLVETTDKGDGQGITTTPMPVPMGEIDIWMGSKKLIRGLDYILIFPNVFVNCFDYLQQPADEVAQRFHVRLTGFCNSDLSMGPVDQYGFVEHGALSNNRRYNLRDDKVQQVSVGGGVFHRSDLKFFEDRPGFDVTNPSNGLPYQIKDIVVPLKDFTERGTYELRALSLGVDQRVSDYMTQYFPMSDEWQNSSARRRYRLVSPFFSHMLYLLENNVINPSETELLTDAEVLQMCLPHEPYLAFDPLTPEHAQEDKFVAIIPHRRTMSVDLSRGKYRFLQAVVRLYGQGKITINNYVTFSV